MKGVSQNLKGFLYLFGGIFFWATVEPMTKLIQGQAGVVSINFFRMLFGAIVLLLYIKFARKTTSFREFARRYPKFYIPSTLIGLVLGMMIFFYGVTLTKASLAATIFSANPIVISTFMIFAKGERKTWSKILGIILGFLGVLLIMTEFRFTELLTAENLIGNFIVFIGMILWSIHVIIGKLLLNRPLETVAISSVSITNPSPISSKENAGTYPSNLPLTISNYILSDPKTEPLPLNLQSTNQLSIPIESEIKPKHHLKPTSMDFNAITFFWSVILNAPFLFIGNEWIHIPDYSGLTWALLIYLGVFTGGLGYVLFFQGLQLMEASKGITIFYLKPLIATSLSFILLQEIPGPSLYIGIVIEIIALFLVARK